MNTYSSICVSIYTHPYLKLEKILAAGNSKFKLMVDLSGTKSNNRSQKEATCFLNPEYHTLHHKNETATEENLGKK